MSAAADLKRKFRNFPSANLHLRVYDAIGR
jgi:hypothetical protein